MPRLAQRGIYIGVDPGATGGIALLTQQGKVLSLDKTPTSEADWCALMRYLLDKSDRGRVNALVEKVGSMPGNAARAMFTFGVQYGFALMALAAHDIPIDSVTPSVWQRGLGIPKRKKNESKTAYKNRLKRKAQQLYPQNYRQITLATADALLIAEYSRRKGIR